MRSNSTGPVGADGARVSRRGRVLAGLTTAAALAGVLAATVVPSADAAGTGPGGYATLDGGTTGGAGGDVVSATTGTEIHEALCSRSANDEPIIIRVEGTINHANTSKVQGSCNTTAGQIELRDVANVSIIGVGDGALFDQLGIHIRNSSNIILQNLHVRNVKKSGTPTSNGGDAIGMESDVSNVWVDHVTLEASGGESEGYDGLFDLKANTRYVTLSYSILRNSGRGGLIGSSDSDDQNGYVTFHHNLYWNIDSRTPLLRFGTAHSYNNHYVGITSSGMNPRIGGRIKAENNYFEDSKDPIGTFYTDDAGSWDLSGNIFDSVTWSASSSDYRPAGPDPRSTTSISIPYSYRLDDAACVPDLVNRTAGADRGLLVSNSDCAKTTDPAPDGPTPTTARTTIPLPLPTPTGANLSIGAGADGSGKASGTSYGNVRDGDPATYWSPPGDTGRISVKWGSAVTVGAVVVREAPGFEGNIDGWQVIDHDTGEVIAEGAGAGAVTFTPVATTKLDVVITDATGTPAVAELETYATGS